MHSLARLAPTALVAFAFVNIGLAQPTAVGEMAKIRVAEDGSRFVVGDSGETFTPWGFNYLGRHGELIEESWAEDWPRVERDFREMRKLGANVARVHLQFGTYLTGPDEVNEAELARLRKLLDLAEETGLYLDVTGLNLFRLDQIPAWYDAMDEAERWRVQARWWEAIAETCAGRPAVFCYDLTNEPVIGGAPAEGAPKWVGGELGGFWFVQRLTDDPGDRTQAEIAEAWVAQLTAAIRRHDAETPITVGAIPWAHVWPNAKPVFYAPDALAHLDFVSIHMYPKSGEIDQAVAATKVYDLGKPLVVEEVFAMNCSLDELDEYIAKSTPPVDGYIAHYFGYTIAEHNQGAEPAGPLVAKFLEYWREKGAEVVGGGK